MLTAKLAPGGLKPPTPKKKKKNTPPKLNWGRHIPKKKRKDEKSMTSKPPCPEGYPMAKGGG